jgi:tetratricopeptide (TPR) repeat protein
LADLDQAVAIEPRYAEAWNNRGIVRQALGSPAQALADFDRALEIRPRYAEALTNRGVTRQALGDLAGALADLDRAIGICPDRAEAHIGRAAALKAVQDWDGAFADYEHVLRLVPREAAAAVHHLRADVRVNQRRFADALAECNQALAVNPRYCMAYVSRGNVRYHLRDLQGTSDYWTAFQLNPEDTAAEIIRILTTDIRQDVEEVLENCRKHVRICPDDVVAYARRGLTLLLLGRDAEAARDFTQILQRKPEWKAYLDLLMATARRYEQPGDGQAPSLRGSSL